MTSTVNPTRVNRAGLTGVLVLLFATGWGANHFAAMIPVLHDRETLSPTVLNGAFGIYAVGLLPGLLFGGGLSDRIGRRPVVLPGAAVAGLGNLLMLGWHQEHGVYAGRLVVGMGAGLAIGAGTAWAADLGGKAGAVLAGVALSSGFALGPLISGLLATFVASPLTVPFAATGVVSVTLVVIALTASSTPSAIPPQSAPPGSASGPVGTGIALLFSLPMALWVFASVTLPLVVLTQNLDERYRGPLSAGVAAVVALGSGVLAQFAGRRFGWGPRAGVMGAILAAAGFGVTAVTGLSHSPLGSIGIAVVLGVAYGLCLRDGLIDVETMAPPRARGALTGVFYVFAYLGFGLPVLLTFLGPRGGVAVPLTLLAAAALVVAVHRAMGHPGIPARWPARWPAGHLPHRDPR
ncbi:MFS transporter [Rhodococcus phenolicus]|uniref:MFS transporter n=1 Tax=Rhodococcus phenolicus TaxID=263849 RepID=UPI0008370E65|nr:MFS transporter [Rhodococcus phenolicus]